MFSKADIEKYFTAEKSAGLLLLIIGMVSLLLAATCFFVMKTNFYKGVATPLLILGLFMGVVGFSVYNRSDADRTRNVYAYDMNPAQLKDTEIPRMEKVMRNFVWMMYIEMTLLVAGIGLFLYFRLQPATDFWKGLGMSLALLAMLALAADYVAKQRASIYLNGLKAWSEKIR
jgi:ABC-type xylose transport system permease subunit